MPQRTYQAPEFNVRDTREVRGVQVTQADTRAAAPITFGDESWRDRMLQQLGSAGSKVLDQMADVAFSNLYLEGQAAAGQIESENELQGNPLTRDWKVAGYRDTMGKLALADSEAQFSVDIKDLREKGPEELQAYLAHRRSKLMPAISGMSREARAAASGQLLLQDRAAIKSHTTEHTKFIIEQKSAAVQAQWNVALRTLGAAQVRARSGDANPEDFKEQLRTTAGTMVGSVWMDNSLPDDVKQQLTFEMVQSTLANDSVELYDYLAQNEIANPDGTKSTLLSRLDGKQQQQLANTYREAQSRTNDQRNFYQMAQVENIEAQIANNVYMGTYSDLSAVIEPLVQRKVLTGARGAGILGKYLNEQYKKDEQSSIAAFALQGDTHALLLAGKTQQEGVAAITASLSRANASPEQVLTTYLTAGKNGLDGAYQEAGKILGTSLRQVRSADGTILPQHMQTFQTIDNAVRAAEASGNRNARMQLLSGMPEQDRMFTTRVFALVDSHKTLDEAIAIASDTEAREADMSPSKRGAIAQSTAKAVTAAIDAVEPMNILEQGWTWLKSIASKDAGADWQMRVQSDIGWRDGWFSDNKGVTKYVDTLREELHDESDRVLLVNPTASADEIISTAKANVAARTIQTRHGPVVLPHGANAAAIFGVSPANLPKVGPALDKMLQETKADARWNVKFTHRGIFVQEYDRGGAPIGSGHYLNPKDVSNSVQSIMDEEQAQADYRYGRGRKASGDGVTLRYNGTNTAGVEGSWMLALRDNLVDHEGIRATPYQDLSGNKDASGKPIMTVGVGVSSHNPRYPRGDKIGPDEIRSSFLAASNDAAIAGRKVARAVGIDNKPSFMLMSELAYQSGVNFAEQNNKTGQSYREFLGHLKAGHVPEAQEAFKRTAAWYYSADTKDRSKVTKRQQSYLKLIEQSIQGG